MGLLRKHTRDLRREDRKHVGRTSAAKDLQIAAARGSYVTDASGRRYLDFQLGWCVGNLGWNHPAIVKRLRAFDGPSYVGPGLLYEPWVTLAREVAAITPGRLARTYRCTTGTEAVELALQIAVAATGRTKLVSVADAYHGNSFATKSLGEGFDLALPGCKHLALPLDTRAIDRLETLLKHRDVAAFILEPVITNLAVEIPADEFLIGARELCDRYGTLLIFDEVACGFGRTGKLFASEHSGVVPDIMTVAKAITNGHAPLAATITTAAIADEVEDELDFYATFGWLPLATEAALATLAVWRDEGDTILDNVRERSSQLLSRLLAMPWRHEAEVRIKGLAVAVKTEDVDRIADRCEDAGLLVTAEEEELMLFPALTISERELAEALDILERAV
jgi:acetylornithine/succinyldiaminopimelate/putrescine aminotransferase